MRKKLGTQAALDAPSGSVLIWNICGSHPAGHIAENVRNGCSI